MSLTINTNTAAISAAFNLAKNNDMLNKSLNRLSSGKRITKPSDDAGGLAMTEVTEEGFLFVSVAGYAYLHLQDPYHIILKDG